MRFVCTQRDARPSQALLLLFKTDLSRLKQHSAFNTVLSISRTVFCGNSLTPIFMGNGSTMPLLLTHRGVCKLCWSGVLGEVCRLLFVGCVAEAASPAVMKSASLLHLLVSSLRLHPYSLCSTDLPLTFPLRCCATTPLDATVTQRLYCPSESPQSPLLRPDRLFEKQRPTTKSALPIYTPPSTAHECTGNFTGLFHLQLTLESPIITCFASTAKYLSCNRSSSSSHIASSALQFCKMQQVSAPSHFENASSLAARIWNLTACVDPEPAARLPAFQKYDDAREGRPTDSPPLNSHVSSVVVPSLLFWRNGSAASTGKEPSEHAARPAPPSFKACPVSLKRVPSLDCLPSLHGKIRAPHRTHPQDSPDSWCADFVASSATDVNRRASFASMRFPSSSCDHCNPVFTVTSESLERPPRQSSRILRPLAVNVKSQTSIYSDYVVGKKIGEGTWGVVHLATERCSGLKRVVKKLHKRHSYDIRRFRHEIAIHRVLDHPFIVKLYQTYEDDHNIYMVLEYCGGGDLFDRLAKVGRYPEAECMDLMYQVLSAIAYTHDASIAHRDIKPENFLFMENNSDSYGAAHDDSQERLCSVPSEPMNSETTTQGHRDRIDEQTGVQISSYESKTGTGTVRPLQKRIKLVDFGLSKSFKHKSLMKTMVGTLYYLSPQVLLGKKYDHLQADMWAAGVLFHVLLTGEPPFNAPTDQEIVEKIKRGFHGFRSDPSTGAPLPNADIWRSISPHAKHLLCTLLPPTGASSVDHCGCMRNGSSSVCFSNYPTAGQALRHPWFNHLRNYNVAYDLNVHTPYVFSQQLKNAVDSSSRVVESQDTEERRVVHPRLEQIGKKVDVRMTWLDFAVVPKTGCANHQCATIHDCVPCRDSQTWKHLCSSRPKDIPKFRMVSGTPQQPVGRTRSVGRSSSDSSLPLPPICQDRCITPPNNDGAKVLSKAFCSSRLHPIVLYDAVCWCTAPMNCTAPGTARVSQPLDRELQRSLHRETVSTELVGSNGTHSPACVNKRKVGQTPKLPTVLGRLAAPTGNSFVLPSDIDGSRRVLLPHFHFAARATSPRQLIDSSLSEMQSPAISDSLPECIPLQNSSRQFQSVARPESLCHTGSEAVRRSSSYSTLDSAQSRRETLVLLQPYEARIAPFIGNASVLFARWQSFCCGASVQPRCDIPKHDRTEQSVSPIKGHANHYVGNPRNKWTDAHKQVRRAGNDTSTSSDIIAVEDRIERAEAVLRRMLLPLACRRAADCIDDDALDIRRLRDIFLAIDSFHNSGSLSLDDVRLAVNTWYSQAMCFCHFGALPSHSHQEIASGTSNRLLKTNCFDTVGRRCGAGGRTIQPRRSTRPKYQNATGTVEVLHRGFQTGSATSVLPSRALSISGDYFFKQLHGGSAMSEEALSERHTKKRRIETHDHAFARKELGSIIDMLEPSWCQELREWTEKCSNLFEVIDSDGSGAIDYSEWLAASIDPTLLYRQQPLCRSMFSTLDRRRVGKVTYADLCEIIDWTSLEETIQSSPDALKHAGAHSEDNNNNAPWGEVRLWFHHKGHMEYRDFIRILTMVDDPHVSYPVEIL